MVMGTDGKAEDGKLMRICLDTSTVCISDIAGVFCEHGVALKLLCASRLAAS